MNYQRNGIGSIIVISIGYELMLMVLSFLEFQMLILNIKQINKSYYTACKDYGSNLIYSNFINSKINFLI